MSELPKGWIRTTLGQVVSYADNETVSPTDLPADVWLLELEDIERDSGKVLDRKTVGERAPKSSKNRFYAGDVLYGKLRPYLNKVVRADRDGFCSSEVIAISPGLLDKNYLFYSMRSPGFIEYVSNVSHGMRMPRLGTQQAKSAPFVLPPLAEQTRIAQKVDELLAQVDTLKARIDAMPALLKCFRQSVLAAAVTGRLTEEWREKLCLDVWSSTSWAEILKNNKDAFKRGPFGSSLTKSMFIAHGYKVYEQYCPINDDCTFARYYISPQKFEEMEAFAVEPGDFLISCSGVSLGRITQVPPGSEPGIINQALLRVRLNPSLYSDAFFKIIFRSPSFQKDLLDNSTGSAIPNLKGVKELKAMQVPLPTLEEQIEIVRRVEQLFSFADQLEARVVSAKTRIDRLTQSILAKAFRGELVPQDPNDEPAVVLLERIKDQRATVPKAKRGRKNV
ncbi:restriction endonuclease subunit S [Pseudomonas sp. SIMBA_068]|uniref:restriction endonuclease subunit S n=1 Tax=Pseudomonas sp. SIMBA_068 TaxID=3085808 RepID=UPI00397A5713